ncbi:hypothetical protein C8J57DRAFT_1599127 [Mycena rebaudengoi]|nr:hypothetical protein C8J57DRAFT_1599127 [Mycena rebaudengoi]
MQMIAPHWRAVLLLVGSVAAQDGIMPVHPQNGCNNLSSSFSCWPTIRPNSNVTCVCTNGQFRHDSGSCLQAECSADEFSASLKRKQQQCGAGRRLSPVYIIRPSILSDSSTTLHPLRGHSLARHTTSAFFSSHIHSHSHLLVSVLSAFSSFPSLPRYHSRPLKEGRKGARVRPPPLPVFPYALSLSRVLATRLSSHPKNALTQSLITEDCSDRTARVIRSGQKWTQLMQEDPRFSRGRASE